MRTSLLFGLTLLTCLVGAPAMAQNPQDGLDLPITEPVFGAKPNVIPPIQPPEPTADDPQDEPPPIFYGEEIESSSKSVIYVIDLSGSMGWPSGGSTRWDSARKELNRSIDGLPSDYTFNIVTFNSYVVAWKASRVGASSGNKEAAKAWVNGLIPDGGTATGPGVAIALEDRENMAIVLLTDGDPNAPTPNPAWHRELIRRQNLQGAKIHVFGINAWGAMRSFCQSVASDSGGNYVDIN